MGVLRLIGRSAFPLAVTSVLFFSAVGCGSQRRLEELRRGEVSAVLRLPSESEAPAEFTPRKPRRDTLKVDDGRGGELFIMKAVRDEDGRMVASDVIDAAYVTATFRNVAERHGKVDLRFQVVVPESLLGSAWQLRLWPDMAILGDTVRLDGIAVTGTDYRKAQLRGYQQYERFLSTIISDTTRFIDLRQLEIFLRRNIPALYAMRTDSTEVSDEAFASVYGATEKEAVDHYTSRIAVALNERRKARRERMYRRYIKSPMEETRGFRLDTVMRTVDGDFVYDYVQTITTRPKLRKVDIVLSGGIWEAGRRIYDIPEGQPLTFYISSLSTLVDPTEKYLSKVIERRADASAACWVEFALGSSEVDTSLGNNAVETERIRGHLRALMASDRFVIDSIVVSAGCSPEGGWRFNERLSERRSEGVTRYFRKWMKEYADSLAEERGMSIGLGAEEVKEEGTKVSDIAFIPKGTPENWKGLDALVRADSTMTDGEKERYFEIRKIQDPDEREKALSKERFYRMMRETMYPYLRTVGFNFHLHRRDMVKDTVHTTELDTVYMRGVQAIRDRDYATAVKLLRPYRDYNAAVAYCLTDRDASALAILEKIERTPKVEYLLAVLCARKGNEEEAVGHFLAACRAEPSYRHRGNLDPEIASLIKEYGLNEEKEEGYEY